MKLLIFNPVDIFIFKVILYIYLLCDVTRTDEIAFEDWPISDHWSYMMAKLQDNKLIFPCNKITEDEVIDLYILEADDLPEKVSIGKDIFALDGRKINYDSKLGFILENPIIDDEHLRVYCVVTKNKEKLKSDEISINPIELPTLSVKNNGRLIKGDSLKLNCSVKMDDEISFDLKMINMSSNEQIHGKGTRVNEDGWWYKDIIIFKEHFEKEDEGEYGCKLHLISDDKNVLVRKYIKIQDPENSYINISEANGNYEHEGELGSHIKWKIVFDAWPEVDYKFYDSHNTEVKYSERIHIYNVSSTRKLIKIVDLRLTDSGLYKIVATNKYKQARLILKLTVKASPKVSLIANEYNLTNKTSITACEITGYPIPELIWSFQPCLKSTDCSLSVISDEFYETTVDNKTYTITSQLNKVPDDVGVLICQGANSMGKNNNSIVFYISDIPDGFGIEKYSDDVVIAGDSVRLTCILSVYKNYTGIQQWYFEGSPITNINNKGFNLVQNNTKISKMLHLTIANAKKYHSGNYTCKVGGRPTTVNDSLPSKHAEIYVKEKMSPKINRTYLKDEEVYKFSLGSQNQHFDCVVDAYPIPTIEWLKDDIKIAPNSRVAIEIFDDYHSYLKIKYIKEEDSGIYKCRATNMLGRDQLTFQIKLKIKESTIIYITVISVLVVIFTIMLSCLVLKIRHEKRIKRQLKLAGLYHFERGDTKCLNPELGLDEQADLLPYDRKWEFPRENLKLGSQLGSGAFGVVMKAQAKNIIDGEETTVVAVKMVKKTADATFIKALASELKIMVHLGKHINVVNLLGACTNNVAKRELLMIVEYCRFGNIHNFLLRHRRNYIDQIDHNTDTIDTSIGADVVSRSYSVSSYRSRIRTISLSSHRDPQSSSYTGVMLPLLSKENLYSINEGCEFNSNGSVQPEWRSNYRGDYNYNQDVRPITTQDLVYWAFQVARGMDYLCNRKVLHGDLAARNILLADDNIVKICDFGLAKNMYKNDNYKKKGEGPMPVKWMAIESIRDGIFSTQSDVWAYGVVMWELFTLSEVPYSGMEINDEFCDKLIHGHRLKKPEHATGALYDIMYDCWRVDPMCRPTFSELANKLGKHLDSILIDHLVNMNEPYVEINNKRIAENGDNDYLAMVSAPNYGSLIAPSVHEYINHPFGDCNMVNPASPDNEDHYIPMNRHTSVSSEMEKQKIKSRMSSVKENFLDDISNTNALKLTKVENDDSGVKHSQETHSDGAITNCRSSESTAF